MRIKNIPNCSQLSLCVSLFLLLTSCAFPKDQFPEDQLLLSFSPNLEHMPSVVEVPKHICAVGLDRFHEPQYEVELTGQSNRRLRLLVGPASEQLFMQIFPKVFHKVTWGYPFLFDEKSCETIIQPVIKDFEIRTFYNVAGAEVCWANVTYQFDLFNYEKVYITSWTVTGNGESIADNFGDCAKTSAREALEDAGIQFMTSFYDVPEAERWLKGIQIDQATVKTFELHTEARGNMNETKIKMQHDTIFTLITSKVIGELFSIRVILEKNKGTHSLLINPADITIEFSDESILKTAPSLSFIASLIQTRSIVAFYTQSELKMIFEGMKSSAHSFSPLSSAYGMPLISLISNLLSLQQNLANRAMTKNEGTELMNHYKELGKRELKKTILRENEQVDGYLYFIPKSVPSNPRLILSIPVIDVDAAERYLLKIPLDYVGRTN